MKTIIVTFNNEEHSIQINNDLNEQELYSTIINKIKEELKVQNEFNLLYKYSGDIMNDSNIRSFINKAGEFYVFELPSIVESHCISQFSNNSIPIQFESDEKLSHNEFNKYDS